MIHSLRASTDPLDDGGIDALYSWPRRRWMRANFVVSADGAIEVAGTSGALGGSDDRQVFRVLRGGADVVLAGSGTVRAEDYGVVRLEPPALDRRLRRGQQPAVPVAVLSARATLDPGARLFREAAGEGQARPILLTSEAAPAGARRDLADVAEVVVCGDAAIDYRLAVGALHERGLDAVLCEGGPTVLRRLAGEGLLDELCLTFAPLLAGPDRRTLLAGDILEHPLRLEPGTYLSGDGGALFARYRVRAGSDE